MAPGQPRQAMAQRGLLGPLRGARQQPGRHGGDARSDAQRDQDLRGLEGPGAARPARVGAVSLRQHGRRRTVQRVDRSDPDERVADDRMEQRRGDDQVRDARRLHARDVRHLVARLPDVHRDAAQRHQPPLRDVRQRRRRHGGAHRVAGPVRAHVVPAEPAPAQGALVAAQQQQLRGDGPAGVALPVRPEQAVFPPQLLPEEQALDREAEGGRAGRLRADRRRPASRLAGRAAARAADPGVRDFARDGALHRGGAGEEAGGARGRRQRPAGAREGREEGRADHPPVPGRQLHRPHGPAVQPDRRRAARLSVPGRRTTRRSSRTTTPGGRSASCSARTWCA